METIGKAKDGKEFNAQSPEVIAYKEKYPDVTLEAAIGSVIMEYEKTLGEPKNEQLVPPAAEVKKE